MIAMTREDEATSRPGLLFWLLWTLATACAWYITGWLFLRLSNLLFPLFYPGGVPWEEMLWIVGPMLGILQWPVLYRYIPQSHRWILANALGLLPGSAYVFFSKSFHAPPLLYILGIGFLQWLVLRTCIRRAYLWLLGEAVALVCAVIPLVLSRGTATFFAGAVFGALTGGTLVWMLRHQVLNDEEHPQDSRRFRLSVSFALLALALAPVLAAWQTTSFQNEVYCGRLELGTARENIYPHVGKPGPVPQELAAYSGKVVSFTKYWSVNSKFDEPGIGFDTADRVALVVRIHSGEYYPVQCPWTFMDYLSTLP